MIYEIKKIAKIVDEVLTFFMFNYKAEALIEVKFVEKDAHMKFVFSPVAIGDKEFTKLKKLFSSARQPELESYYWQLAGETEENNEISIVAMMCDTCEMSLTNNTLELLLTRKKN